MKLILPLINEMAKNYEEIEDVPVDENINFYEKFSLRDERYHTPEEALKVLFGYDDFRPGQKEVIESILSGRDAFAVMPTGAGKSVCYQIPAMLLPGITLVISPLISLMQDQVKALNEAGVSAAFINSALSETAYHETIRKAKQGLYKIIYVAPERLITDGFMELAKNVSISMVTVDEAHCISQWGQDFRPSYMKIVEFVRTLATRPIISAFTATATETVRDDIICTLGLNNPFILVTGFDRGNLFFQVDKPRNKDEYVIDYISKHPNDSGIVYCATRKNVDKLYDLLKDRGVSVAKYHAGIPNFQRFIREQLGWKLIHTEKLLKLEKKPAHAEAFMGITEFTDIRDYCILCVVLMYLEDAEEGRQFLLSELIDYVETQLKNYLPVDWTSFTQRKSLVRVLQYMERLQMLRVYEGKSESFGLEAGQEVLYENTGYSKYFTSSFTTDISGYESWRDFEKTDFEEFEENRGTLRINRVYRQLAVCPALYWNGAEDADALYLKNQRQWIGRYLRENMGGNLEIYRNAAFFTLDSDDCYGTVHPREAQIAESVLLICAEIQKRLEDGKLQLGEDERILMSRQAFAETVINCRRRWKEAWSKEYAEMDEERLVENVLQYMKNWMMVNCEGNYVVLLPAVGRLRGQYPADYRGDDK